MLHFRAYFLLMIAQLAIGAAAIFARYALTGTGPITVSALRLGIAAIPLVILGFWRGLIGSLRGRSQNILQMHSRQKRFDLKSETWLAIAGISLGFHFASWITSLTYISVAVSTLLVCTTPVWNALYETWILKKRANKVFWFALGLALIGLILVSGDAANIHDLHNTHAFLGILLALLGSFLIGFYLVIVEKIGEGSLVRRGYSTTAIITRTFTWAAVCLFVMCIASNEKPPSFSNWTAWGGILGMALISQSIGHTLINISVRTFSPSIVAFATLLEPIFAGVLAAVLFSERLSPSALFGGVIIFVALVLALYATPRKASS